MNSSIVTTDNIIADARAAFDYYLAATIAFVRFIPLPNGTYLYPEDTVQADTAEFAGIFTCAWGALKDEQTFNKYYRAKPLAFKDLARIVTPNAHDHHGFTRHARFWENSTMSSVTNKRDMRSLCRTLRNGLAHFNFRYIDTTPSEYFNRMGLVLPFFIPDPDNRCYYRIFICDWKPNCNFIGSNSDTRIIETHFAHFRYHLFMFLARLFSDINHEPYRDILTQQLIT